ncbi:MAG TPA: SusC/RagA family TonB-linked outer membrane protein [Flavisolibacter sp.]|nr:SusC/RagA family TonB-linked outer membrane protein [Flavisolibacter sp.]
MRRLLFMMLGLLFVSSQLLAQNRTVTGTISDNNGQPLPGATISVVGGGASTTTDPNGFFSLLVPQSATRLEISSIGFATQTVAIPASGPITLSLAQSTSTLGEVIVTGYRNQRRSEYAGAATKVSAKEIQNVPIGSFEQILQGRAPGLTVLSGSGQPGNAANVVVRGPTSIQGGSNPLYIVDNIPVEAGVFQSINPNDIASVDVLRDATAAALYGNRGAAGVIVVTTKRGKAGKLRIGYSGQYGVKAPPKFKYESMSSSELLNAQEALGRQVPNTTLTAWGTFPNIPGWQYSRNNPNKLVGGVIVPKTAADFDFGDRQLDSLRAINTDWNDEFFRTGTFNNHEISFSGGTGKTTIYSNLGFYSEQGINAPSDMKRVTLRNNMDYRDEKVSFQLSSNLGYTKRNFQAGQTTQFNTVVNPFFAALTTPRYITARKPDGTWNASPGIAFVSPTYLEKASIDKSYNDQFKGVLGLNFEYNFTKNIYAGAIAGIDFRETQNTAYNDPRTTDTRISTNIRTRSGSLTEGLTRFLQANAKGYVGYRNTFNNVHSIDVTGYAEYLKYWTKTMSSTGFGVDTLRPNTPAALQAGNATNQLFQTFTGGKSQRLLQSLLGIARYTYKDKYTITGSYRYDGTSSLPEKNRLQGFYSVGAVWNAGKENFISNISWINTLRVKYSRGQSANVDNFPLGDFGYLAAYTRATTVAGVLGTAPLAAFPGNDNADFEYTNTDNFGIEFALFKSRFYGDIQLYNKVTKDLYAPLGLSAAAGFGNGAQQDINAGEMYNRGIEVALNYDVISSRDVLWTIFANGAYNKNRVTSLAPATQFEDGTELIKVGEPLGSHFEVGWAGVDAATGAPLFYDLEGKVTNVYSAANKTTNWGTWRAPYNGGFGSNFRYKGLEISTLFTWQAESYRVNNLEFFIENPGFLQQGLNQATTLNFWQRPGDIAATQSPLYQNQFSSKLIQDASFIRWRNLTVSYTLPTAVLSRTRVFQSARIYVLGQNLYTFTKWKGLDPEDDNNISLNEYPNPKAFTVGLEIGF